MLVFIFRCRNFGFSIPQIYFWRESLIHYNESVIHCYETVTHYKESAIHYKESVIHYKKINREFLKMDYRFLKMDYGFLKMDYGLVKWIRDLAKNKFEVLRTRNFDTLFEPPQTQRGETPYTESSGKGTTRDLGPPFFYRSSSFSLSPQILDPFIHHPCGE